MINYGETYGFCLETVFHHEFGIKKSCIFWKIWMFQGLSYRQMCFQIRWRLNFPINIISDTIHLKKTLIRMILAAYKFVTWPMRSMISDHYILHEFDDGQPITGLDSESGFLIGRPVINLQAVEEVGSWLAAWQAW